MNLEALPGGELVAQGLEDLRAGTASAAALLVRIGASRLRRLGIAIPAESPAATESAEHRLFGLLARADPRRAHSRYNALLRRLASFTHAAR